MGNKILYILLFTFVKMHAILPMPVLYLLSDILYFFIYHVVRYRRKVVRNNMKNSFPDKTEKDIIKLERRFYHHFADIIVEIIKLSSISKEKLEKRAKINNPELVFDLMDKGHTCVIFSAGHYGNWEFFTGSSSQYKGRTYMNTLYRPLTNKAFDRLFIYIRTRLDGFVIKKNDVLRSMINIKKNKIHAIVPFVADQTPSKANIHYWAKFMNQDTAMYTGQERIAKKLDIPFIFTNVIKVKRGFYTIDLILITDKPKDTPDFYITDEYTRLMEKCIMQDPAYWLWTHMRWKHKRSEK